MIHKADLKKSARLQLTMAALEDGEPHSTAEISKVTGSMSTHTDISELRANGINIGPAKYLHKSENGRKIYTYQLI
jgi:hypothetical protein